MVEGRGTEGKGDEAVVERYTEAEGDKNDERVGRREVSKYEKRYSTCGLQMSSQQLSKTAVVNHQGAT